MISRLLRILALLLVCAALLSGGRVQPNVVIVVIDTLRADHLGCYGYERPTSPYIDALAARGVRFANAHAPSSWTAASVASILTGLYPAEHGVETSTSVLNDQVPTIVEAFRRARYATAGLSANPVFVGPEMGFTRGFDRFEKLHGPSVKADQAVKMIPVDAFFQRFVEVATADRMTDAALAWIAQQRAKTAPYFLYVHYIDPHADYFPPRAYAARFGVPADAPLAGVAQRPLLRSYKAPSDPADLATLVGLYDAEIAFTDQHVGRLIAGIEKEERPTLIVVTADHGEEFGEHGRLLHAVTLWEEQLRVPLVMAGAGVPSEKVIDDPVSLVSLWATVAAVAGVPPPPPRTGVSLASFGSGKRSMQMPVFADLERPSPGLDHFHHRAIVDGDWKLVETTDQQRKLFDLHRDPREQTDLGSKQPDRSGTLMAVLQARNAAAAMAKSRMTPGSASVSAERREQLKALGYAH